MFLALVEIFFTFAWAGVDFQSAYQAAAKTFPLVQSQLQLTRASDARLSGAYRALGPTVALRSTMVKRDADPAAFGQGFAKQKDSWLTVTQPIFKSGREYSGMTQVQAQNNAERERLEQRLRELYARVADAYYGVLIQEKEVENLLRQLKLTQERVAELRGRARIGRSRESELLLAQSQEMSTQATVAGAQRDLERARATFTAVTGLPTDTPLTSLAWTPFKLDSLGQYLGAIEAHPEMQARAAEVEAAQSAVWLARGGHLPDLDVRGNYFLHREGGQRNIKWDVSLNLTMPIFESGVTTARVREEAFRKNAVEQQRRDSEVNLTNTITSLYKTLVSDLERAKLLESAAHLGEKNYLSQKREYGLGLVTNLEVLQALNGHIDTKRLLDRVRLELAQNHAKLEALTSGQSVRGTMETLMNGEDG